MSRIQGRRAPRWWRRAAPAQEPARSGLDVRYWEVHDAASASAGLSTMARRLPMLVGQAVRIAWQASRRDTAAALGLNLLAGLFTAFGLLATTGVLESLFGAGPT